MTLMLVKLLMFLCCFQVFVFAAVLVVVAAQHHGYAGHGQGHGHEEHAVDYFVSIF